MVKSHSIKLSSKEISAGGKYSYKVTSTDKAGNSAQSDVLGFQVPGYKVKIVVSDEDGNPVEGINVSIDLVGEMITDENGEVIFDNVPKGTRDVTVGSGDEVLTVSILVKDQDGLQTFGAVVSGAVITSGGINFTQLIGIILALAGVLSIAVLVLFRGKFFKRKEKITTTD